ncbi:GAF domain-containing protein [Rhodococcus ruber]
MTPPRKPESDALAAVYAGMSGLALSEQTLSSVVELTTSLTKDTLPGSVGAGITLLAGDGAETTTAATDPVVERLDALQYELGEGPCLTALRDRILVRVDDLATESRWPRWSALAAEAGMGAVLSAPLVSADRTLGAIKVYSARPHAYTGASEALLRRFAAQVALLLANASTLAGSERLGDQLKEALRTRDLIATAKGIVMLREHLGADEALRWMLALAERERTPMREVAAAILATVFEQS